MRAHSEILSRKLSFLTGLGLEILFDLINVHRLYYRLEILTLQGRLPYLGLRFVLSALSLQSGYCHNKFINLRERKSKRLFRVSKTGS